MSSARPLDSSATTGLVFLNVEHEGLVAERVRNVAERYTLTVSSTD
ncbi:hypothetical protein ACIHCX_29950 [Streptomyces sp. NPDC052043]